MNGNAKGTALCIPIHEMPKKVAVQELSKAELAEKTPSV